MIKFKRVKNKFIQAVGYLVLFLICILIHFLWMKFISHSESDFTKIYIFTGIVCFLTLFLIAEANEYFHKYLGFIFIGIIALKLIAAKIFMNGFEPIYKAEYKYSFVVLYLLSLVLITIYTAKLLLNPKK